MKERLDIILVEKGLFDSREKARRSIMAGVVFVDGQKADKPGMKYDTESTISIKENLNPYVSRGGLKLEKALKSFNIDLNGKIAIDVGASTGGFTDCMLKHGAVKVFAIDVGYGQLAWDLRSDERVVCLERTNIRYVKPDELGVKADFSSIDVSFISLTKVIPVVIELLNEKGSIISLVKPQFEAGRDKVGKHGVVREASTHFEVIQKIVEFCKGTRLKVAGLDYSPIKGPEGNIEYLLHLVSDLKEGIREVDTDFISGIVEKAHSNL